MKRFLVVTLLLLSSACRQDMHDGAYVEPLEGSEFFTDGRGMRPKVPGTIARGGLQEDDHFFRGVVDGKPALEFPMPVTSELVARGASRFVIHCAPCHGAAGTGDGMVVKRGFTAPPSYHIDRLREAPVGYYFDVISNGFGAMYDFSERIEPADRWAIVSYVRALQLSQDARTGDVPADQLSGLKEEGQ